MAELTADVLAHRAWLLSFLELAEGALILDLGCGRGDDLRALAARAGDLPIGLVGLDSSEASLALARDRAEGDPRLRFQAYHLAEPLPFADASVDAVYSHNLLECLADPPALAAEVARVLRPGGQVVVGHWDWDSQLFDGADRPLIRRLVHGYADWQQSWMEHADGWMGRRLWGVFHPGGFFEGEVHARSLMNTEYSVSCFGFANARALRSLVKRGVATAEEVEAFEREQERLHAEGRYFYSVTGYAFVGRRTTER